MLESVPSALREIEEAALAPDDPARRDRKTYLEKLRREQTNNLFNLLRCLLCIPPRHARELVIREAIADVSEVCAPDKGAGKIASASAPAHDRQREVSGSNCDSETDFERIHDVCVPITPSLSPRTASEFHAYGPASDTVRHQVRDALQPMHAFEFHHDVLVPPQPASRKAPESVDGREDFKSSLVGTQSRHRDAWLQACQRASLRHSWPEVRMHDHLQRHTRSPRAVPYARHFVVLRSNYMLQQPRVFLFAELACARALPFS